MFSSVCINAVILQQFVDCFFCLQSIYSYIIFLMSVASVISLISSIVTCVARNAVAALLVVQMNIYSFTTKTVTLCFILVFCFDGQSVSLVLFIPCWLTGFSVVKLCFNIELSFNAVRFLFFSLILSLNLKNSTTVVFPVHLLFGNTRANLKCEMILF